MYASKKPHIVATPDGQLCAVEMMDDPCAWGACAADPYHTNMAHLANLVQKSPHNNKSTPAPIYPSVSAAISALSADPPLPFELNDDKH